MPNQSSPKTIYSPSYLNFTTAYLKNQNTSVVENYLPYYLSLDWISMQLITPNYNRMMSRQLSELCLQIITVNKCSTLNGSCTDHMKANTSTHNYVSFSIDKCLSWWSLFNSDVISSSPKVAISMVSCFFEYKSMGILFKRCKIPVTEFPDSRLGTRLAFT